MTTVRRTKPKSVTFGAVTPKFDLGTRVHIDDDTSIKAVVTGFLVRAHQMQFEVAWFNNGSSHSAWLDEFRLTEATD